MGLDIYFYKVKNVCDSKNEPLKSIQYYRSLNNKRAKDRIRAYAKRSLARLAKANDMEYESMYKSIFPNGIAKYTPFEFQYAKMCESVKPYPEVEQFFKRFVDYYYAHADAYFRKVNVVYKFFEHKLVDEKCFVTLSDINELIQRAEEVLKDKSRAAELLPTRSGFLFGSTDYNDYYFDNLKEIINTMEKLKTDYNDDTDIIFVSMSW